MRELLVNVDKENNKILEYIYRKIEDPIRSIGGVTAWSENNDKIVLGIAVRRECFELINKTLKSIIAEVLAIGYKNRYLRENIVINGNSLLMGVVLDTMSVWDSNNDINIIRKDIDNIFNINIEGCYGFRLINLKKKWNRIIELANTYEIYLNNNDILLDFLGYLMESIPTLYNTITVIINDDCTEFELLNVKGLILDKFESFSFSKNIEEDLLFNLICYNPNIVNFFVSNVSFSREFFVVLKELFRIEFFPENN